MKKLLFLAAMFMQLGQAAAGKISVADVVVPKGGQADVVVKYQFENSGIFSGYNFSLVLPDGITAVKKSGKEMIATGDCYTSTHTISTNNVESTGENIYACFSTESECLTGTDGVLLKITITSEEQVETGESFTANVCGISLGKADGTSVKQNDFTFTVTVGEPADPRTVLDEASTTVPESATGVDVRVRRTIKADEWSTICLPFAMTEAQVEEAFGSDVELGDFYDYELADDGCSIAVLFDAVKAIEANHPYIIKVSADVEEFTVDGVDVDPQDAEINKGTRRRPRSFVGNYVAGTVVDDGCLFLNGGKFWYSVGQTTIKGYRAYFNFDDLLDGYESGFADGVPVSIKFNIATDIKYNNRETINKNGECYNLGGQRVVQPTAGMLYIQNSRKIINNKR